MGAIIGYVTKIKMPGHPHQSLCKHARTLSIFIMYTTSLLYVTVAHSLLAYFL